MAEKSEAGIIYHRSKTGAYGAVTVGFALIGFAAVVLTQESIAGISFSEDLRTMATYLALPFGVALLVGHSHHAVSKGPTMVAENDGITVLFTPEPVGPIHWAEVSRFVSLRKNGVPCLGIVLHDPAYTMPEHGSRAAPLARLARGKKAHLAIRGKMLDDPLPVVVRDLEQMRQVHTWHLA